MKQKKGTKKHFVKKKTSLWVKLSYIGGGLAAVVGVIAFIMLVRIADVTEELTASTPVPLPAVAPVTAWTPPVTLSQKDEVTLATETEEPPKETETPQLEAVFHEPEPPVITLPCEGEVSVPFSKEALIFSKTMQDWRVHSGIDIAVPSGTEIKAAADGVISSVYQDAFLGQTVVIDHEGGYQTLYQNLASTEMAEQGAKVTQGQCIGAAGDSAAAEKLEEAHVHFSMKQGETFVNPMDFLKEN